MLSNELLVTAGGARTGCPGLHWCEHWQVGPEARDHGREGCSRSGLAQA